MSVSKQAKLARQHENTWADLHGRVMSVHFDYEEHFPKHVHNFIKKKAVSTSSCTGYFVPCLLSTTSFVLGLNSYVSNGSRSFPCYMYIMVIGPPGLPAREVGVETVKKGLCFLEYCLAQKDIMVEV